MLDAYLTQTQALLQLPSAPITLYDPVDLTRYINIARGQLAGEAECIRLIGTIPTVADQLAYNFADIDTGVAATNGIQGVLNVRQVWYQVGSGRRLLYTRAWEWFSLYNLNSAVPASGPPTEWSQFAQGSAPGATGSGGGGSFYISPNPDDTYSLLCDCVCYPIALTDDSTIEAIPYLWTDAVPYFAAYMALLSAQTEARRADAEAYYNYYETFVQRARTSANPSQGRWQYSQAQDPVQSAKLGRTAPQGGG